jgi:hypothetical protein
MSLREHLESVNEAGGSDRITGTEYKQMAPMSGEEIAQALYDQGITKKRITRQAVSNTLKRAMDKVFAQMKKANPDLDAFEIAAALATGWGTANTVAEMSQFFKLFPPKIRKEIETAAAKRYSGGKK